MTSEKQRNPDQDTEDGKAPLAPNTVCSKNEAASPATILPQAMLLQCNVFPSTPPAQPENGILRIATYNIHKGVRGVGPIKRTELQNLALAVEEFDADLIFLQEVRKLYNREDIAEHLKLPGPQADFLAPEGYTSSYISNAFTRKGQHGNALLSRWPVIDCLREDISNSRFEQRGLLHVRVKIANTTLHCIVVHLSLLQASRDWQLQRLAAMVQDTIPPDEPVLIAGDFNDWNNKALEPMRGAGLQTFSTPTEATYPSFAPHLRLDRIFTRGLTPLSAYVPKGKIWTRMSDHLPLIGEFTLDSPAKAATPKQ